MVAALLKVGIEYYDGDDKHGAIVKKGKINLLAPIYDCLFLPINFEFVGRVEAVVAEANEFSDFESENLFLLFDPL